MKEDDLEFLEDLLGKPLPIIDPIYYMGAKIWGKLNPHPLILPYLLSKLYDLDEMKMVMNLPGTPSEVAEKLNLSETYVSQKLARLFEEGKILPGKVYHKETSYSYMPTLNPVTLRDHIGMSYNKRGLDWNLEREMFLLADRWCIQTDYTEAEKKALTKTDRIIPKWNSIKNLPGVMHCENAKEIIYENFKSNTIAILRCVCKSYRNLERYGKANLEDGGGCETGIKETCNQNGHCFFLGQRGVYMGEMFGYKPSSLEEIDKLFEETEDTSVIYRDKNMPQVGTFCTCCMDCCVLLHGTFKNGIDTVSPSRFRPVVKKNKCVGCGLCKQRCMFDAISYDADGNCVIDENKCKGCGNCVIKCPSKALKMKIVHDRNWIPDIEDYVN